MALDNLETVEATTQPDSVQDDAVQDQAATALEQFMAEGDAESADAQDTDTPTQNEPAQDAQAQETAQTDLPKGIRGRIQAAEAKADKAGYSRGRAEAESEYRAKIAEYEKQLTEYADMKVTLEAQELARKEHISLELAKRIVRAELGTVKAEAETPKTPEPAPAKSMDDTRRSMLNAQRNNLITNYGIDPMAEGVLTEAEMRDILDGKSDFNAAALRLLRASAPAPAPKKTPAPVANGGARQSAPGGYSFESMTDEEFDRFQAKIGKGHIYKPR